MHITTYEAAMLTPDVSRRPTDRASKTRLTRNTRFTSVIPAVFFPARSVTNSKRGAKRMKLEGEFARIRPVRIEPACDDKAFSPCHLTETILQWEAKIKVSRCGRQRKLYPSTPRILDAISATLVSVCQDCA